MKGRCCHWVSAYVRLRFGKIEHVCGHWPRRAGIAHEPSGERGHRDMRRERRQQAPRVLHHAPALAADFKVRQAKPLRVGDGPAGVIALCQVHRKG